MILEKVTANKKSAAEYLILIWENAIRNSQTSFTENYILKLRPLVKLAIKNMQTIVIAKEQNNIMGFIAVENKKIEMLIVSPDYSGRGVAKALLLFAVENDCAVFADVNEKNTNARSFYEHMGFTVFACSKKNAPILHMKREIK